jgi:hypothetical protein
MGTGQASASTQIGMFGSFVGSVLGEVYLLMM